MLLGKREPAASRWQSAQCVVVVRSSHTRPTVTVLTRLVYSSLQTAINH